jgi:hypothetical protein
MSLLRCIISSADTAAKTAVGIARIRAKAINSPIHCIGEFVDLVGYVICE